MTVMNTGETTVAPSERNGATPDDRPDELPVAGSRDDRTVRRIALALTVAPFVVGAVALLAAVGGDYHPWSDHALTELQTRSVGRDEVLLGLYSRDEWNHPGPALFYVLAPFYWLTGGMSVGISIGALAINGAAVAGMGVMARRRGGTPLMLITLLACGLLMRTLSAEFLQDPWNCFVTTLPFGLLILLSWSMWQGDRWALPVAAAVTTFLAQTHVGFVVLATPLLAWGAIGLLSGVAVAGDRSARLAAARRLSNPALVGVAVLVVGWLPTLADTLGREPSNLGEVIEWFRHPADPTRTVAEGWKVMTGPLGGLPEWMTTKRAFGFAGQSSYVDAPQVPWMLAVLVAAGVALWRRRVSGTASLMATLGLTFTLGVTAVARTVGVAFDYRLRWTFMPAMVAFVAIAWAGWTLVAARWPRAGARALTAVALVGVAVLSGVNVITAATAGTPQNDDSESLQVLTDQVIAALPDDPGTILVNDAGHSGSWHARGLLLQLERRGFDVGVEESLSNEYGRHRVVDPAEVDTVLVVTRDQFVDVVGERPGARLIAEWYARPESEIADLEADLAANAADAEAGRIDDGEKARRDFEVVDLLTNDGQSTAYHAVVFVQEEVAAPPAGPPPA
jgi:hypothetical protein